jgi:hypothetical protein
VLVSTGSAAFSFESKKWDVSPKETPNAITTSALYWSVQMTRLACRRR